MTSHTPRVPHRTPHLRFRVALCALPIACLTPTVATAQGAPAGSSAHVVEGRVGVSNFDDGILDLGYQYALPSRLQLGARVAASKSHQAFFAGYAVDDAANIEAEGRLFAPLYEAGPLVMQLRLTAGARSSDTSDETLLQRGAPGDQVTALTGSVGLRGNLRLGDGSVHAGVKVPVSYQVDPEGNLDEVGTLIETGGALPLTSGVWLTANFEVGGMFGSDGDAGKMLVRGMLGVRGVVGADDPDQTSGGVAPSSGSSAFIHTGWRVGGQGGHLGHGPAVELGVLVTPHLKIGIASHTRPGPMNSKTFDVAPSDGQTYKGKSRLSLRSDGAFLGLLVAPSVDLSDALQVELPVAVGQGAYGFYLTGDDRKTPDGRRVSKWENELQDGMDSGFALGVDAGLRIAYRVRPWLRVVAGGHYTQLFGYESYVRDDYSGLSASLGLELGGFR